MSDDMTTQVGNTIERLGRLESKVDGLGEMLEHMAEKVDCLSQAEDRRFADRLIPDRVRSLEDQALQTRVYLAQLRWILAALLGSVFAAIGLGILNLTVRSAGG